MSLRSQINHELLQCQNHYCELAACNQYVKLEFIDEEASSDKGHITY